jgi:hypothetical protein
MFRNKNGQFINGHPFGKRFEKGVVPKTAIKKGEHRGIETEFKKGVPNFNNRKDHPGIKAMHVWVKQWKGKANHCEVCGKTEKRMYHWANIDHTYRRVLDDYISMCVPCHKKYDYEKNKNKGK